MAHRSHSGPRIELGTRPHAFRSGLGMSSLEPPASKPDLSVLVFDPPPTERVRYCLAMSIIEAVNAYEKKALKPLNVAMYILTVSELLSPGFLAGVERGRRITLTRLSVAGFNPAVFDPASTEVRAPSYNLEPLCDGVRYHAEYEEMSPEVAGGRWGIEMYPIGKNVNEVNLAGFTTNRVRAVQEKFMMEEEQRSFFAGEFVPKIGTLQAVARSFNIFPTLRYECAMQWVSWVARPVGRVHEAFVLTFALTDGAGFSGPNFVMQLLLAYPALVNFPELRGQISEFRLAYDEFSKVDVSIAGYLKVIHGDKYALFRSTSRGGLLALAIMNARNQDATVARFLDTSPFFALAQRANAFLTSVGSPTIAGVEERAAVTSTSDEAMD